MRARLLIPALLLIAVLLGAALAHGEISRKGNLQITFSGGFSPRALPRDQLAPVTLSVEGAISTTDGTQPPAVKRMEFSLNSNGRLSTVGLPLCTNSELQSTTTQAALARCRPALVGRGHFGASVQFANPTGIPAQGTLLAFNSTLHGKPAVLLHLYGTTPVQASFILPLAISQQGKGQLGTILSTKIPTLAGGFGSVTEVDLKLGRNYTYRGQRRSYLSARCAAPAGFPGAVFTFARGSFEFADGRTLRTTISRDCTVR
jgi:hypothetical protein